MQPRPAGAARLHHHHRGLQRLVRVGRQLPRRARRRGRERARRNRGGGRRRVRRRRQPAAGLGALRRAGLDAGDDGHRAQSRPQRPHGGGAGGAVLRPPLRLRQLSPLHPDVRLGGARDRPPLLRGIAGELQARLRRRPRHRYRGRRLGKPGGPVQGAGRGAARRAVSPGREGAALGRHRRGVRELDEPARGHLPQAARHPFPLGYGGQRAGDGVRQHGRGLRDRRRLHARSLDRGERVLRRVPAQRAGRGRGRRDPHAASPHPCGARGGGVGRAVDGRVDAGGLRRPVPGPRDARGPLPRHAGHRVHRPVRHALDAADARRETDGEGRAQGRLRDGRGRADRQGGCRRAHRPAVDRPASPPDARPGRAAQALRPRHARVARRGVGPRGVQRRRGRDAVERRARR